MTRSRNWLLITGVSLPFVFLFGFFIAAMIAGSVAVPPSYDALLKAYDPGGDRAGYQDFDVVDGQVRVTVTGRDRPIGGFRLYRLDVATMTAEPIDVSIDGEADRVPVPQLEALRISTADRAPDGYRFSNGYDSGPGLLTGLFWGGRHHGPVIEKFGASWPVEDERFARGAPQFVGWVLERD